MVAPGKVCTSGCLCVGVVAAVGQTRVKQQREFPQPLRQTSRDGLRRAFLYTDSPRTSWLDLEAAR